MKAHRRQPRPSRRACGGGWDVGWAVAKIAAERKIRELAASLSQRQRAVLQEASEDPDAVERHMAEEGAEALKLVEALVDRNLIIDWLPEREGRLWIDKPSPEKELDIGVGESFAWQTPLHREAVRKAPLGPERSRPEPLGAVRS